MKPGIMLLGLLISSLSYGQMFEIIETTADSLRRVGKLDLAIAEYAESYKNDPEDRYNTLSYACALSVNNQIDTAFYYLNIAVKEDTNVSVLNDADFYNLLNDKRWSELENTLVKRIEEKHGEYKNSELSKELWRMKIKDQAFYYHIRIADKLLGEGSPVTMALWELKNKLNQENVDRLEEIIGEYGWPKKSYVRGSAALAAFLIIQHADIEIQKKYLPLITDAANNKEASWSHLALLIDRINLREGGKQVYGSQIHQKENGDYYVANLVDPEFVNQRRKSVGLDPIEEYIIRWGITWDVEQKEK